MVLPVSGPVIGWRRLVREQGVLLGLIILLMLIFLTQCIVGPYGYGPFMCVPEDVTTAWQNLRAGEAASPDWRAFSTLLSCAFLHGGPDHIASNLLFLWIFAALISELLGWRWMLTFFVFASIGASITHVLLQPNDPVPMLGASGAVMGFEGAYLGLATRFSLPQPHVWPMARPIPPANLALLAVLGVAIDYFAIFGGSSELIAFGAHVGGFTTGLLIAGLVAPRPRVLR